MQKFLKNYATPTFLLGIKFFTAFRTGLDTLIVAGAFAPSVTTIEFMNAVLYVLLIDAVMTGLWLYAAYAGDSQRAQLLKVFAILGAWVLYIGMIIIGWEAHPEAPFLALMGRIAGGIALGYDTWDTISGPVRSGVLGIHAWIKRQFAGPTPEDVYRQVIDRSMVRSIRKSGNKIGMSVMAQIEHRVDMEIGDIVSARLPLPSDIAEDSDDEPDPIITLTKNMRSSDALKRAWENCRESLTPGAEFRRGDIEECTTLARSRAGDVISYGMALNEVVRISHGRYMYNPVIDEMPTVEPDISPTSVEAFPTNTVLPPDF